MRPRVFLDAKVGSVLRRMFETNDGLEFQRGGRRRKIDQRYAIPKDVMNPSGLGGFRRDRETRIDQTLIEAIARPEHQLMQSWPHRIFVTIGRRVMNRENSHKGDAHP